MTEALELRLAHGAALGQVRLQLPSLGRIERAQHVAGARVEMLFAMDAHAFSSRGIRSESFESAWRVQDFTVPSGALRRSAISLWESPAK